MVTVLRVSTKSEPARVAGALAGTIREKGAAELRSIGAGALNQAIKAIAVARSFLSASGIDLVFRPAFLVVTVDGQDRTAIRLMVEPEQAGRRSTEEDHAEERPEVMDSP